MTMLHPEVQRASTESVFKKVGVTPYVSRPLPPNDEGRGVPLPENVSDLSLPVRLFQRVSSGVQTVALAGLVILRFGQPIMERVSPSTETLVEQLSGSFYNLADRLNQREIKSVEELNEKDLDMIVDGALLIFGRVGGPGFLSNINSNEMVAGQVSAFEAAYRAGLASKSIKLYREQYYADNPELEGTLSDYDVMIEGIVDCEVQGLSSRDCVSSIRRAIYENRRNIPGMENMREEDIMPEALRSYLSEEPLGGSLSGNAVAENMVWDKRRRLEIKREQARRAERFGRDQRSANANRVARRLR
jgi:hypothetical protein